MKWLKALVLSALTLLLSGMATSKAEGKDPTITIMSAAPVVAEGKPWLLGTFAVDNPGKKTLISIAFMSLRKDGGILGFRTADLEGDTIPDIKVPAEAGRNYDCLAYLVFKENKEATEETIVASKLSLNRFVPGTPTAEEHGKLTNEPTVDGQKVTVDTNYRAENGWKVSAKHPKAKTYLFPVDGGRLSLRISETVLAGSDWKIVRKDVDKGKY